MQTGLPKAAVACMKIDPTVQSYKAPPFVQAYQDVVMRPEPSRVQQTFEKLLRVRLYRRQSLDGLGTLPQGTGRHGRLS